jgi:very-short-patch-repair endonuclease
VDFYCPETRLAVEIDGRSHDEGCFAYDTERQVTLERQGVRVLRFSNDEVLKDVDGVIARLYAWLEENPSLEGGGPPGPEGVDS